MRVLMLFLVLVLTYRFTIYWTQKTDPTLAGYRVKWGAVSGQYTTERMFGRDELSATFDWPAGVYYFAVTAYYEFPPVNGVDHWESGNSNEVRVSLGEQKLKAPLSLRLARANP